MLNDCVTYTARFPDDFVVLVYDNTITGNHRVFKRHVSD